MSEGQVVEEKLNLCVTVTLAVKLEDTVTLREVVHFGEAVAERVADGVVKKDAEVLEQGELLGDTVSDTVEEKENDVVKVEKVVAESSSEGDVCNEKLGSTAVGECVSEADIEALGQRESEVVWLREDVKDGEEVGLIVAQAE